MGAFMKAPAEHEYVRYIMYVLPLLMMYLRETSILNRSWANMISRSTLRYLLFNDGDSPHPRSGEPFEPSCSGFFDSTLLHQRLGRITVFFLEGMCRSFHSQPDVAGSLDIIRLVFG